MVASDRSQRRLINCMSTIVWSQDVRCTKINVDRKLNLIWYLILLQWTEVYNYHVLLEPIYVDLDVLDFTITTLVYVSRDLHMSQLYVEFVPQKSLMAIVVHETNKQLVAVMVVKFIFNNYAIINFFKNICRVSPRVSKRVSARLLVRFFSLAKRLPRVSDRIICTTLCKTLSKTRFLRGILPFNSDRILN